MKNFKQDIVQGLVSYTKKLPFGKFFRM